MTPPATATETPITSSTGNQIDVKDVGPARKRITITVPAAVVDDKLGQSMGTLSHQTALPGFRKGKAPQKLLERRFGTSVRNETKNQLVASAYATAIEELKLKPVGEPEPGENMKDLEVEPGKPLVFSLEVEIVPDFEIPQSFEGIEIKKPLLEISAKHIEDEVKRQQLMHGIVNKIEEGFKEDDRVVGYAAVSKEGEAEPFFRQDNVVIVVPGKDENGRGQVLGLMIDGLADMLKGKRVGDSITIETVGPEGHEREDLRGAKITIVFDIRIGQRIDPATAAVVAEKYGLASEEILREQIKFALEHRRDEEQSSAMREQAVSALGEIIDFELPEKLSSQQAARNLEQFRLELLQRGMNADEAEEKLAEAREESEAQARDRLKRFFLLQRLGEHFKVDVTEQEVNGRIAAIAAQSNMRPEKLRSDLAQAGRLGEVARMIRDQKAADKLVAQCKQVEITADEWNKVFRDKQGKESTAGKPKSTKKPAKKAATDDVDDESSEKAAKPRKTESKAESKAESTKSETSKKKTTKKK